MNTDDGGRPQISGKSLWHAADHKKKPVCFTCLSCGGACQKRKIGDLAFPAAAASQIDFSKGADRIQLK
jgi:hypothetical protein